MKKPLQLDLVEYYEYDCWTTCTPNGCPGHETDIPVGLDIGGVSFYVSGYQIGDYPVSYAQEEIERVKQAVERLQNALALAAVSGGEFCAEARAAGRGPCGACSWCVKQAQERAERAEAEVERLRKIHPTHLTAED